VEEDSHYPDWVKPLTGQDMVDAVYGRLESAVNHYRVSLHLKIMYNEVETGILGVVRHVKYKTRISNYSKTCIFLSGNKESLLKNMPKIC
jgi:hypothetical protein